MGEESDFKMVDGIKSFVEDSSSVHDFYPAEDFEWLRKIEDKHFWFRSRKEILRILFKRYINSDKTIKILELGCGMGEILKMFAEFENAELTGAEISLAYLKFIRQSIQNIELVHLDVSSLPYSNLFDVVCAFDVLEHITDDRKVINSAGRALKSGAFLFITVPQYQWLWSKDDVAASHKRRYSKSELKSKLESRSFEIIYSGSFVFILLPLMAISRLLKGKKPGKSANGEFDVNPVINYILYLFMKIDVAFIKMGFSLPWGGSLVFIAKKR